jgi:hypothetical protein
MEMSIAPGKRYFEKFCLAGTKTHAYIYRYMRDGRGWNGVDTHL